MARRSPMNPRYQKNTGPAGKTRRSASSAKPKREAGGAADHKPAKKPKPTLRETFRAQTPPTPEMRKWRRVWWILIGVAFVLALSSAAIPQIRENERLVWAVMAVYTLVLGSAFYIDLRVIRPLRQQQAEAGKAGKSGKKD